MSRFDYEASKTILALEDWPFFALVMAAMRRADTDNMARLTQAFPEVAAELEARYWAPYGGTLPTDPDYTERVPPEVRAIYERDGSF